MTTPVKKRIRRAKKAMPLEARSTARKAVQIGAAGAGASIAGKVLFSALRFLVGATIVVAAVAAAISLIPQPAQRRIMGNIAGRTG